MALITFTQHGTAAAVCQWVCKTLPGVKRRLAGSSLSTLFSLSVRMVCDDCRRRHAQKSRQGNAKKKCFRITSNRVHTHFIVLISSRPFSSSTVGRHLFKRRVKMI